MLLEHERNGNRMLWEHESNHIWHACSGNSMLLEHGGFFVRVLHQLLFLAHVPMLYSDDLLLWQNRKVLPLGASVVLCFFACFGVPISWPKLQMGRKITW